MTSYLDVCRIADLRETVSAYEATIASLSAEAAYLRGETRRLQHLVDVAERALGEARRRQAPRRPARVILTEADAEVLEAIRDGHATIAALREWLGSDVAEIEASVETLSAAGAICRRRGSGWRIV